MARIVTGPIEYPNGTAIGNATIKFSSTVNNYSGDGSTPIYTEVTATTDAAGALSVTLNNGSYRVLLQESGASAWLTIGTIVVETGASIELGSLIDTSDTSTVLTYADIATQTWVAAYVLGGGSPSDIAVTSLGVGTAGADEYLRINAAGNAIVGEAPRRSLQHFMNNF